MALQSGGVIKKGVVWTGSPASWDGRATLALNGGWSSYAAIYRSQLWVQTVVSKRARGTARLPLKVYERDDLNRPEAAAHPYAELLRRPNPRQSPFEFWLWVSSIYDVYGEAFLGKVRDRGGRPVALIPMHPTAMHEEEERDGQTIWTFQNSSLKLENIPDEDLVHPKTFNPDSFTRGLSNLESLRSTLENEDAARRATSSFWRNGGRPSLVMVHPGTMSQPAMDRLKIQWDDIHAGVDNFGKTAILEEGMKPEVISLSAEEAQYIESRKLNREEVCAAYDVPPPVVHILDHATYSNITEQMRSMYRDTMAPHLKAFESALEMQLRDGRRPGRTDPDFGDDVYAEFLLDEVLRGDFETRSSSYQQGITSGWLTPAEVRRMENLPFIEGSDRLLVQGAMVPMQAAAAAPDALPPTEMPPAPKGVKAPTFRVAMSSGNEAWVDVTDRVMPVEVDSSGRGSETVAPPPSQKRPVLDIDDTRVLMGRLSRWKTLAEIDGRWLVEGLAQPEWVRAEFNASKAVGESVAQFRSRMRALYGCACGRSGPHKHGDPSAVEAAVTRKEIEWPRGKGWDV